MQPGAPAPRPHREVPRHRANPGRFGIGDAVPHSALPIDTTLVMSETDPWLRAAQACLWAQRWGSHLVNLGAAGHINAESGFGPWPWVRHWVAMNSQRIHREQRWRQAGVTDWQFAVWSDVARLMRCRAYPESNLASANRFVLRRAEPS